MNCFTGLNPAVDIWTRKTLTEKLQLRCRNLKDKLTNIISEQQWVCVTADIWSTKARSFMGMTCHWLNAQSLDRSSSTLR